MSYFVVKYSGPFGYIKPWTAVRDEETFSQQFLTPSIAEGIEKKLFPELLENPENQGKILKIKGHRLNYQGISIQQERTWAKEGIRFNKKEQRNRTAMGILKRGLLIAPNLYLAFEQQEDAEQALCHSVCLCRNEDLLLPECMLHLSPQAWEEVEGFELKFANEATGFKVGYNRYADGLSMYGKLEIYGNPIRQANP